MKVKILSLLVPALLGTGVANPAEIYNKDGNKLDLFGKMDGLHVSLTTRVLMAIRAICVLALKVKPD